jgi:hypothetical protein
LKHFVGDLYLIHIFKYAILAEKGLRRSKTIADELGGLEMKRRGSLF